MSSKNLNRVLSGGLFCVLVSGLLFGVSAPAAAATCHNDISERTGEIGCGTNRADKISARSDRRSSSSDLIQLIRLAQNTALSNQAIASDAQGSGNVAWNSGLSCFYGRGITLNDFEQWRGARVTAVHGWSGKTLDKAVTYFSSNAYGTFTKVKVPVISISTPLLPESGTLERCAAGAYDRMFSEIGKRVASGGRPDTILRLGWEMNLRWASWSAVGRADSYKACFRRAVQAIRSVHRNARIEWSPGRGNFMSDWRDAYPGDDYVDIIGLSYYDRFPPYRTQADWDTMATNPPSARVLGIETLIAFARERGKKVGVGEWAVSDGKGHGFDNPLYIENMYRTFQRHKDVIAYETYFNCGPDGMYKIYPPYHNPHASEKYRQLW